MNWQSSHPAQHSSPLSIRKILRDLPIARKLAVIIALFSVIVIALLGLSYFGMSILSSSRAYVGGEGLWSKAQKQAVLHLERYAGSEDEKEYKAFLEALEIPLGDRQARLELEKPLPDYRLAAEGFIRGGNHPDDIPGMIFLVRHFGNYGYMKRAVEIWRLADEKLAGLKNIGEEIHREINSPEQSPRRIEALLAEARRINRALTPLENEYSFTLGLGARWLKGLLLIVMTCTTGIFLTLSLIVAFIISRRLSQDIDSLRRGAARIASGDYSITLDLEGADEIGDLARSFHAMADQRKEAEQLKNEFFANISHEIRTPLTLILSPLESLLSSDEFNAHPTTGPALKIMHNNATRLLQLVNGILDFSKLAEGKVRPQRSPVRIARLTESIYNDFQPLMQGKNLKSEIRLPPPDSLVLLDRYLYERILFNLLSNAVKFTPAGGRIELDLRLESNRLKLSVSDSGIGIAPADIKPIFERFRQVEGASSRRFEGTGLGLALAKEFAELLGGDISVKSKPGEGSTFFVTCAAPISREPLPSDQVDESAPTIRSRKYLIDATAAACAPAAPETPSRPRILIAEDNVEMASYISSLVSPFCETRVAGNGHIALDIMKEWRPDVVLSDVMMPEFDGLSLCREIKGNQATSMIPIVMLTALTHREALLEGWNAGADEYLFKPFHPKELVTRIESILRMAKLNRALEQKADELSIANQELEAFSYSISHDLRTPLRAIDGFSRELLENGESSLDPQGRNDLQRIRAATQRMAQLIDDLLELSRLPRREMTRKPVDLSARVTDILQQLQGSDPQRHVHIAVAPHVTTQGDPPMLDVALQNLLSNAWKFTKSRPETRIEFGTASQNGKQAFFIRDNGVGFDMAYAGKLFKPFQRLHDPKAYPGTGIGLALVERVIRRHQGHIWVESGEERGATFYFTLS